MPSCIRIFYQLQRAHRVVCLALDNERLTHHHSSSLVCNSWIWNSVIWMMAPAMVAKPEENKLVGGQTRFTIQSFKHSLCRLDRRFSLYSAWIFMILMPILILKYLDKCSINIWWRRPCISSLGAVLLYFLHFVKINRYFQRFIFNLVLLRLVM